MIHKLMCLLIFKIVPYDIELCVLKQKIAVKFFCAACKPSLPKA